MCAAQEACLLYRVELKSNKCMQGGKLLPSAHQIEREHRVMKALNDANVPTPKMLHLCTDDTYDVTITNLMPSCFMQCHRNTILPHGVHARRHLQESFAARVHQVATNKG